MSSANLTTLQFRDLLSRALNEPGVISRAYTAFHGYSVGNQILAFVQCVERGIPPGPIATFMGWKEKGRYVRKGERALTLCMPVTCKRAPETERTAPGPDTARQPDTFTRFVLRPHWFVLSQTEGAAVDAAVIPMWDQSRALEVLEVVEEPFTSTDGNCQGYARERTIAVSPVAALPHKTRFHELGHVVLGHTAEAGSGLTDSEHTPRSLREVEAEAVAMVCLEALGLPGADHCRGYIQHWNQLRDAEPIPERSAQRIAQQSKRGERGARDPVCAEVERRLAEPALDAAIGLTSKEFVRVPIDRNACVVSRQRASKGDRPPKGSVNRKERIGPIRPPIR